MGTIEETATRQEELRVGDLVEVRSEAEILATLDEHGMVESLPFMPEMLALCGRRFRVHKLAHKACDTIVGALDLRVRHDPVTADAKQAV